MAPKIIDYNKNPLSVISKTFYNKPGAGVKFDQQHRSRVFDEVGGKIRNMLDNRMGSLYAHLQKNPVSMENHMSVFKSEFLSVNIELLRACLQTNKN